MSTVILTGGEPEPARTCRIGSWRSGGAGGAGGEPAVFLLNPFARLTVNGKGSSGSVHFFVRGGYLYVTLNGARRRESYGVSLRTSEKIPYPYVSGCAPWTASRFPMFTEGCTDLRCLDRRAQSESKLVAKQGFIAFDTGEGSRVSVRW